MKIIYQDILPEQIPGITTEYTLLWSLLEGHAKKVVRPDTEIKLSHVDKMAKYETLPFFERLNDLQIVSKIIDSEREGFDAAVISCINDPGLQEARGVVDIPVTAVFESALIIAQMLGKHFACVAISPRVLPVARHNLAVYGFEEKFIKNRPIRYFDLDFKYFMEFIKGKDDRLLEEFSKVALTCIEDGADVIIPAHGYLGPAFSMRGVNTVGETKVPIVDGNAAALKLAEVMVELRRVIGLTKSKAPISPYRTPPREVVDRFRKDFGI